MLTSQDDFSLIASLVWCCEVSPCLTIVSIKPQLQSQSPHRLHPQIMLRPVFVSTVSVEHLLDKADPAPHCAAGSAICIVNVPLIILIC